MKFFEKVKNMFTEEVEDEVKVEKVKPETNHVTTISPSKEEIDSFASREIDEPSKPIEFSKPVFFTDNDFEDLDLKPKKVEIKEEEKIEVKPKFEKEIYGSRIPEEKKVVEKKEFKPTPIISPVYGILDKNYHKEDIVSKDEAKNINYREYKESSIDSIRNKAYGTLEDDIEDTLFNTSSSLFKNNLDNTDISDVDKDILKLDNLTNDISKELDELLVKKEKYSDDDIKQELSHEEKVDDDLLSFIDSTLYKKGDEISDD